LPVVVASPFSAGNPNSPIINSLVFDHTSVLKLVEWRWGLPSLTARDASSDIYNLAYALDFSNPQTAVPNLPKPHTPFLVVPCFEDLTGGLFGSAQPGQVVAHSSSAQKTALWGDLHTMAQKNGFPVG
jgi:phospholipase C